MYRSVIAVDFSDFSALVPPALPSLTHPVVAAKEYEYAKHQYDCIMEDISEFEKTLDDDHEIALKLTHVGQAVTLQVTDIGYANPCLMYYHGYVGEQKSLLIQHVSQVNFLIVAVPKRIPDKPPNRIGFR
jgi:hypothetical protein